MAMDADLAQQAGAVIRFFRWQRPSVSVGFKQRLPAWVQHAGVHGIDVVERPTGGGVAVHGADLSFSVVAPHDPQVPLDVLLESIAQALQGAMAQLGVLTSWTHDVESRKRIEYCLTDKSPYALMVGGRKLCGLAVRRYPASWLVQGSMLVRELPRAFAKAMPAEVLASFQSRAISLEEAAGRAVTDAELVGALTGAWRTIWE
jgi:lipoate-protein ligase A